MGKKNEGYARADGKDKDIPTAAELRLKQLDKEINELLKSRGWACDKGVWTKQVSVQS